MKGGIADSVIQPAAESRLHDTDKIRRILSDTLSVGDVALASTEMSPTDRPLRQAYGILDELLREPDKLDRSSICQAHARLMQTCRFLEAGRYIPPGETRSITKTTVDIIGYNSAQCCPFTEVDKEVDYICSMSKVRRRASRSDLLDGHRIFPQQWIRSWRNPFATASWIHFVLTRCNPFDVGVPIMQCAMSLCSWYDPQDGNGRVARIIASIPLVKAGYPPISITLGQRTSYYTAIQQVVQFVTETS